MPKTRTVELHEVVITFTIPAYEINVESGGTSEVNRLLKSGKVTELKAFAMMCRDALRDDIGGIEELVVAIDGKSLWRQPREKDRE